MNNKIYHSLFLSLILLLNIVKKLHAQPTYGQVEGTITNVNGQPIEGISVGLEGTSFGDAIDQGNL